MVFLCIKKSHALSVEDVTDYGNGLTAYCVMC